MEYNDMNMYELPLLCRNINVSIDDYRKQTLLQQHSAWAQKRNSLGPKSTGGLVRNTS